MREEPRPRPRAIVPVSASRSGRRRRFWFAAAFAGAAWLCGARESRADLHWKAVSFAPTDRILILAPHPDDETLGCGGVIQTARGLGLPVRVVFLTYGDANEWSFTVYRRHFVFEPSAMRAMGRVRHDEAVSAARVLGLGPSDLTFLGYPDFGTLAIWMSHWGGALPFKSKLTRARRVPYPDAYRPEAPYKGEEILADLKSILHDFRPTKIFVSHPADHNPDHLALALFTAIAMWDLGPPPSAQVFPYLIHYKKWPQPRGFFSDRPLEPPKALEDQADWVTSPVSEKARALKREALKAHASQYRYSGRYLSSFVRENELFGDFPVVRLAPSAPRVMFSSDEKQAEAMPEQLTDQEKAAFVGFVKKSARLEGDRLVLSVVMTRPLARETEVAFAAFGYRRDVPFSQMPKIRVLFGRGFYKVYDQGVRHRAAKVDVRRTAREITLAIPLDMLGRPEKVLTSARSYLEEVPLDWLSWRVLELPAAP